MRCCKAVVEGEGWAFSARIEEEVVSANANMIPVQVAKNTFGRLCSVLAA